MNRKAGTFDRFCTTLAAVLSLSNILALPLTAKKAPAVAPPISELWVARDPQKLDLLNGAGGEKHIPPGHFLYVKQDLTGTTAKFEIVDPQGGKWKAKLGEEAQPEVAASRLMWAAGYFVDEDYYA